MEKLIKEITFLYELYGDRIIKINIKDKK